MGKKRKDNKNRSLLPGEIFIESVNRYKYYYRILGELHSVSAKDLITLREKEKNITYDSISGIKTSEASKTTLNNMVDKYLENKMNLRATTMSDYIYMYDRFVRYSFGQKKINTIKYSDVRAFYGKLLKDHHMKINVVERVHCLIYPAFEMAVRDDLIRKNPSSSVIRELRSNNTLVEGVRHALTLNQQQAFMEYVHFHPAYSRWYNLFTVLLGTGLRCGEICGLRWADIDFEDQSININHALVELSTSPGSRSRKQIVSLPKTEAGIRIIPMMSAVKEALLDEYSNQEINGFCEATVDGMGGFIFFNKNGLPLNNQNINAVLKRIVNRYNIEEIKNAEKENREPILLPRFSCHHLRHTFCTRYCENETNIKAIQSTMGHRDIRTTLNRYADANRDKTKESIDKFSIIWDNVIKR